MINLPYPNIFELIKTPINLSDERPIAKIFIGHIKIFGLLDSGSNITVLGRNSEALINDLNLSRIPFNCKVSTADGTFHLCKHYVEIPFQYHDMVRIIPTLVLPSIQRPLICGVDFWKAFNIAPEIFEETINNKIDLEVNLLQKEDLLSDNEDNSSSISIDLNLKQAEQLEFAKSLFLTSSDSSIGRTSLIQHQIETPQILPTEGVRQRPYPISPHLQQSVDQEISRMLSLGVISRCHSSPWCNRTSIVTKPNGSLRICLDARKLNAVTTKNSYPLPFITRIMRNMRPGRYYSTLDLSSAFWQIPLEEASKKKTAFAIIGRGLFQYECMPFGLCNAPNTLAHLMDVVLGSDMEPHVFFYLDDIVIVGESFDHHIELLVEVAKRLRQANLTISLDKSKFCLPEIKYCGFIINAEGRKPDLKKVEPILSFPKPVTKKQLKSFLGMTNYLSAHVSNNYARIVAPLNEMLKGRYKGSERVKWTHAAELAFRNTKEALVEPVVLAIPDYSKKFYIQTDACDVACAGFIFQIENGKRKVIEFMSHKFNRAQQKYGASERELLGVLLALEKFRDYIEGVEFEVLVDNAALQFLERIQNPSGRLFRWVMRIQHFKPHITHVKGKDNIAADVLSRNVAELVAHQPDEAHYKLFKSIETNPEKYSNFKLQGNDIYKACKIRDDVGIYNHVWRLYVPLNDRMRIVKENHDQHCHQGFTKTISRLRQYYFWPNMDQDVRNYVRKCEICRSAKAPNVCLRPPMGQMKQASEPFEFLTLDFVGPLPRSRTGMDNLLVVTDVFSKFSILKPMRNQKAENLCKFVENEIFLVYGVPRVCLNDNGPCFKSQAWKKLLSKYNVRLYLIANYFPEVNNTERVNRVIGDCLRSLIDDDHTTWESNIPKIQWSMNTAVHETSKFTPFKIVFGRNNKVSGDQYVSEDLNESIDKSTEHRFDKMNRIREIVLANLKTAYEKNKCRYDLRKIARKFAPGEIVFKRTFNKSSKTNKVIDKLFKKFAKCKVVEQNGPNTCILEDLNGKRLGTFQLKDILKA